MVADPKDILINAYHSIVNEVKAGALFRKYLHMFNDTLYFRNTVIDTRPKGSLVLAGSGKASLAMGTAFLNFCPHPWDKSLFISPSKPSESPFYHIRGDHPLPEKNSLEAGKSMYELISSLSEDDTLIYFLSGGSSALMEYPVDGLSIDSISVLTDTLLAKGLDIREINTLRPALSRVKGGQLANLCKANCYVFVLSDVMGNDLSMIGSGPFDQTAADRDKIREIINTYELETVLSPDIIEKLLGFEKTEVPKIPHFLIGSNMDMMQAAETACFDAGIKPLVFPESLFDEARENGKMIADMIRLYEGETPVCMIFGGECTVTLNEQPGLGGRSQELALSALEELKDKPGIYLLAAGSDGIDGVGGAAGAIVSSNTYQKAEQLGLSIQSYLDKHDSYHFHQQCGSLIITGYSGTNVGDIVMALISDDLLERSVS
jgi:hydroxypyruvate reductase/glycerate 2-kinase